MPKTPIDYSKCEMYKIVCKDEKLDYIYVGHTTNWTKRKAKHKTNSKASQLKLYQTIRENGGWDNFKMLQLESFPCNSRREAEAREDELMTELNANLNERRASRSQQEYKQDNKEYIAAQKKIHQKAHRQKPEVKARIAAEKKEYHQRPDVKARRKEQARQRYQQKKKEQPVQEPVPSPLACKESAALCDTQTHVQE